MVRIDVFHVENDGYYFVPIYIADTLKKELPNKACVAYKPYEQWKEMADKDFIFSLYPNDLLRVTHKTKLKLMEGRSKGLGPVAAVLFQLLLQRLIEQTVALRHIVVGDLAGLGVKLQVGQCALHNNDAAVQRFRAFDGLLMGRARHLAAGHTGHKELPYRNVAIGIHRKPLGDHSIWNLPILPAGERSM